MKPVRTAIIPAGGYGTRFLPATKSIPKEMFPLGNKPVILHVVEEAVASGIERIIFVVAHHKHAVENFFSPNEMLEDYFTKLHKEEAVAKLQNITKLAEFSFVFAKPPYGNGGALLPAKQFINDEPFAVIWGDEVMLTPDTPRLKQCIEVYEKYQKPVISAVEITEAERRERYGMADITPLAGEELVKEIKQIVEKPSPGTEPSAFAAHGAYILPPEVFDLIEHVPIGKNNELWLTDIINTLKQQTGLLARIIPNATYLDCGDPISYLEAQVAYALKFNDTNERLRKIVCEKH